MIPIPSNLALKLVAALGAFLLLALLIHDRNRWKAKTAHFAEQLASERAAHGATVANYRAAAEQARREDSENLARVKAEQQAINERTANDYQSRIAAARARADELRQQAARTAADSRNGAAAPVPGLPASSRGAVEAAFEDGLPNNPSGTGPAGDPMTLSDRLIATEQAIQLDELIKWVRQQHAVPVDGVSGERP